MAMKEIAASMQVVWKLSQYHVAIDLHFQQVCVALYLHIFVACSILFLYKFMLEIVLKYIIYKIYGFFFKKILHDSWLSE